MPRGRDSLGKGEALSSKKQMTMTWLPPGALRHSQAPGQPSRPSPQVILERWWFVKKPETSSHPSFFLWLECAVDSFSCCQSVHAQHLSLFSSTPSGVSNGDLETNSDTLSPPWVRAPRPVLPALVPYTSFPICSVSCLLLLSFLARLCPSSGLSFTLLSHSILISPLVVWM